MAILRDPVAYDNTVNYIATLALFCGISCAVLMLRFGGFKASFNLSSSNRIKSEFYEDVPVISATNGAYRTNRDEFFGNGSLSDPPKRIDPSMIKLPGIQARPALKTSKSTGNLTQPSSLHPNNNGSNSTQPQSSNLRPDASKSTPNVSMNPQGETGNNKTPTKAPIAKNIISKDAQKQLEQQKKLEKKQFDDQKKLEKKRLDDQKKLEKKQLDEQKKRDKLAAQARAKQEKDRKAREKQEAQQQAKQAKAQSVQDKGKTKAPAPKARANPLGQGSSQALVPVPPPPPPPQPTQASTKASTPSRQAPTQGPTTRQYSTNTLESSISRTSGPPAYSETANVVKNQKDNSGNTSFSKPVDNTSSWDMIAQHRQEMSRPAVSKGGARKQTVLDLEYTAQTGRKSIYI